MNNRSPIPPASRKRLPVNPSLEHLQKQAKRLVKQNPSLQLAAAQHQLAREYGCKNWAELARVVETMSRGAKDLTPGPNFAPLPAAANNGDLEEVRRILASADFTQHDLDQALSRATWGLSQFPKRRAIGEFLLEHGADPDGQFGGNYGPIIFAACEGLDPDGIQFLIDAGADVSFGPVRNKYVADNTPVNVVISTYVRGRNERKHRCLDILIAHRAQWQDDIIMAIHRGDAERLRSFLEENPALVHEHFADQQETRRYGNLELRGATLLHMAVEFGEMECVQVLLEHGADIQQTARIIDGIGGQTAIFHAIAGWRDFNVPMLEYLIRRAGEWIDWNTKATFRLFGNTISPALTPMDYALRGVDEATASPAKKRELELLRTADQRWQLKETIRRNDVSETKRLLDAHPEFLDIDLWPVAIHQAKSLSVVQLLLERGLDPNRCSAPRLPLDLAVYFALADIVDALIAAGANASQANKLGERPLDLLDAYEPRPVDDPDAQRVRRALLAAGAKDDLFSVIRAGDAVLLRQMLEANPALAHTTTSLGNALFPAARSGRPEAARLLLEFGADPNHVNEKGNTPLWFAAQSPAQPASSRIEVMKLLLDAGAGINHRCEDGTTALHFAAWRGPSEVVAFLLSRGARNWIWDDKGQTPLDHAKEKSRAPDKAAIVELLSQPRIKDPHFRAAVEALSAGNFNEIQRLLRVRPELTQAQAEENGEFAGAYFKRPYLLEFAAENPIRTGKLPANICQIVQAIIDAGSNAEAITKTLALAASGRVPRECGVQTALLELLVKNGANPAAGLTAAISQGEKEAAETLLRLGAEPGLLAAAGLGLDDRLRELLQTQSFSPEEKENALHAALRDDRRQAITLLLDSGLALNQDITGYGTPLHYAALFGHRPLCAWLMSRGADPTIKDSQWQGTPAGWARHNGKLDLAEWLDQVANSAPLSKQNENRAIADEDVASP